MRHVSGRSAKAAAAELLAPSMVNLPAAARLSLPRSVVKAAELSGSRSMRLRRTLACCMAAVCCVKACCKAEESLLKGGVDMPMVVGSGALQQ